MFHLAPYLNKRYTLESTDEQFDLAMKALGVGLVLRKLANIAKPVVRLTEQDGEYTLTAESVVRNVAIRFRIGERFQEVTPDGRRVETCFTQDRNRLTQVQCGDKITTIVREFTEEEVKVTIKVDDIVSVRIYKLLN